MIGWHPQLHQDREATGQAQHLARVGTVSPPRPALTPQASRLIRAAEQVAQALRLADAAEQALQQTLAESMRRFPPAP